MTDQDWNTLLREPPVTTIAWHLGHVIVGVLAMRNATHFGRAATDYHTLLRDLYRTTRGNS